MKTVNELNKECVNLEQLLIQLGETPEFIHIKQMETLRDNLKLKDYANPNAIVKYYNAYLNCLYDMYLKRVEDNFNHKIKEIREINYKYYNKQRGQD